MLQLVCLLLPTLSLALDNGLARTPPMGWMDWERYRCQIDCKLYGKNCVNEDLFKEMAQAMQAEGYQTAGYNAIHVDDCYLSLKRNGSGILEADPKRFPSGMKGLGDFLHGLGIKFGVYLDEGTRTCGGYPGSKGHEMTDADTIARWGADYLKLDGCNNNRSDYIQGYPKMGEALKKTGRPIVYSCSWPAYLGHNETAIKVWPTIVKTCNLWRLYDDVQDSWDSVLGIINHWGQYQDTLAPLAGPGHWNDPDMLIIGNYALSHSESEAQMALWSIFAAPLIMSHDLRTTQPEIKRILLNSEVIAVNQDPMGKQGRRMVNGRNIQIWRRELVDGLAVVILNTGSAGSGTPVTFAFQDVGVANGTFVQVRDLFAGQNLGVFVDAHLLFVPLHGVRMLKFNVTL